MATITGIHAAATAEVRPDIAKFRETSAKTKKANPAASPNTALICTLPNRKLYSEQVAAMSTIVTSRNGRDNRSWYCTRY